jgi:hypothetical protein
MRVFCPEHKRGFFAPRQSPIKCGNRGHILGELNFQGDTNAGSELHWQYCCNCEHFSPIDFDQDGLERCPVCTRRSSMLYLCDRCHCISFESNTPLQTKNFTLTAEGVPQPSCPGCLQATSTDLYEHTCDTLGASFITALNSCPSCGERLDIGPSFPSSVANYLRRTKAANKVNVTFDYYSELFVPVADGEFVLINNRDEAVLQLVIPRQAKFASARNFYELYQDFYHCSQPNAGEVQVIEPAAVVRTVDGWKLRDAGVLEVLPDQPKKIATAAVKAPRADVSTPSEPGLSNSANEPAAPCHRCGTLIESRYTFCWKCGNSLSSGNKSSVTHRERSKENVPSGALMPDDDEQTVQHEPRPMGPPTFSWANAKRQQPRQSVNGSVLKLLVVAVLGIMLVSLTFLLLTRSPSRVVSVTAAQPVTTQADTSPAPVQEATPNVGTEPIRERTPAQSPEDSELKQLREKRIAATRSERLKVLETLARTEKKYPNDYRFPYERAKVAIKGRQKTSRDEAFAALSRAAEKAIHSGKAREMLENLQKDSRGDFQKLSQLRREWSQLQEALKSKDAGVLNAKMGL